MSKDCPSGSPITIVINGKKITEQAWRLEYKETSKEIKPTLNRNLVTGKIPIALLEEQKKPEITIEFIKDVHDFDFPGRYITELIDDNTVKCEGIIRKFDKDSNTFYLLLKPQGKSDEIPKTTTPQEIWNKAVAKAWAIKNGIDPEYVLSHEYK